MPAPVGWKIQTKDRRGREVATAIFSELKIADFSGLCVAIMISRWYYLDKYMIHSGALHNKHDLASGQDLVQTGPYERSRYHNSGIPYNE